MRACRRPWNDHPQYSRPVQRTLIVVHRNIPPNHHETRAAILDCPQCTPELVSAWDDSRP